MTKKAEKPDVWKQAATRLATLTQQLENLMEEKKQYLAGIKDTAESLQDSIRSLRREIMTGSIQVDLFSIPTDPDFYPEEDDDIKMDPEEYEYLCKCGFKFGAHLGKYGCPNCGADSGPAELIPIIKTMEDHAKAVLKIKKEMDKTGLKDLPAGDFEVVQDLSGEGKILYKKEA